MEWERANVDPGLRPDSGEEDAAEGGKEVRLPQRIPKRWAMWKALEDLINGNDDATGRLILETEETDDGEQRYIRVLTRKEILQKFDQPAAIVHLDATLPFELVKHFLPDLETRSRSQCRGTAHADHPGGRAAGWQVVAGA